AMAITTNCNGSKTERMHEGYHFVTSQLSQLIKEIEFLNTTGTNVSPITILSEKGAECRLAIPWKATDAIISLVPGGSRVIPRRDGTIHVFSTEPGQQYLVTPA